MDPDKDMPPADLSDDDVEPHSGLPGGDETDVTGNGGITKKIITAGRGPLPEPGSDVEIHYIGQLVDGTVFESSREGQSFKFKLGQEDPKVLKCWDLAVAKMKRHEKAMLTVEPQYAYGSEGREKVPPNSTVKFEIELIDWRGEKDISKALDKSLLFQQSHEATGSEWEHPRFDSTVVFSAKCLSGNGSDYDERQIKIGYNQVAERGLARALKQMGTNEEGIVRAKAKSKYNPGETDQVWEVKLKSFEKAKSSWEVEGEKKLEKAQELKEQGNNFFKEKNLRFAGKFYKHALEFVNSDYKLSETEKTRAKKLKSVIASNSAAVFLQTQNWPKAQEHASTAITADPLNYKAFLRRGKARANLDLCDDGKRDLNQALLLATEKDDKATIREAKAELALMAKKEHDRFRHDQKLFTNLFDRMRSLEEMENKQREAELARQKQLEEEEKKRREAEIARQQEEQKAKDTAMKTDSTSAETTPENASETTMKTDATPAEKAPEQAPQ